MSEFRQIHN